MKYNISWLTPNGDTITLRHDAIYDGDIQMYIDSKYHTVEELEGSTTRSESQVDNNSPKSAEQTKTATDYYIEDMLIERPLLRSPQCKRKYIKFVD